MKLSWFWENEENGWIIVDFGRIIRKSGRILIENGWIFSKNRWINDGQSCNIVIIGRKIALDV